jgi:hypothetical protein
MAGTANYSVTSNTAWAASSSETWANVTSSGNGNGILAANYTQNPGSARVAAITLTANGLSPVIVYLNQAGAEPSNFPADFTGANITLNWVDATGDVPPTAYLIRMSSIGFSAIPNPVDGISIADGPSSLNVPYGVQVAHFNKLVPNTTYYFKLFAYTGSGSMVDYKLDGAVPQVQITATQP